MNKATDKKTSKFKSIFRSQINTALVDNNRKPINRLEISPPIIQHSTSIFSLVSPIRSRKPIESLYQAKSPAPEPPHSISTVTPKYYKKAELIRRHSCSSSNPTKNNNNILRKLTEQHYNKVHVSKYYSIETKKSWSTPPSKQPTEKDKIRKMQELEDLITGRRRESTLRFTLTPKGLK